MRAILIDPETKTFTEIQIADEIAGIQKVLRCGRFTTGGRPLRGSLSTGFDTLYVSDDNLEDREGPRGRATAPRWAPPWSSPQGVRSTPCSAGGACNAPKRRAVGRLFGHRGARRTSAGLHRCTGCAGG